MKVRSTVRTGRGTEGILATMEHRWCQPSRPIQIPIDSRSSGAILSGAAPVRPENARWTRCGSRIVRRDAQCPAAEPSVHHGTRTGYIKRIPRIRRMAASTRMRPYGPSWRSQSLVTATRRSSSFTC